MAGGGGRRRMRNEKGVEVGTGPDDDDRINRL